MTKKTVEHRIAEEVLQGDCSIILGGRNFSVAPPSLGTLMEVSAIVSNAPKVDADTDDPISETLRIAKDFGLISDVVALLIIGAKKRSILSFFHKLRLKSLSRFIRYNVRPSEIQSAISDILVKRMDVGFFLSTGISLSGINLIRPTKNQTTVSGLQ